MVSFFDIYSLTLLAVSLAIFILRYIREEPPVLPYLLIAITCATGNWLGDAGGGVAASMLLVAASFLFLSCLLYPRYRSRKPKAAQDDAAR